MTKLALALLLVALFVAESALAASPEEAYWAARDKAIARVKALEDANASSDKISAVETSALADLEKRLRAIVGAVSINGFPSKGKINLATLGSGVGFGMLDGLVFSAEASVGEPPSVVVTTKTLLQKWLSARAAEKDDSQKVPGAIDKAIRADPFYTFAIGSDAAYSQVADLEAQKPARADFVVASLGRWAQDIGPSPLTDIVVALGKGERVSIADVTVKTQIPEIAACKAVWDRASAKAETLLKAYHQSGEKDQKQFDLSSAASSQGDKDWIACVRERAKGEKFYPAVAAEAQDIANRLAGE